MPTRIAEYYIELQRREGLEPIELVGAWDQNTPDRISQSFRAGIAASRLLEQEIPLRERSSNQSIGNQVADFFVPAINAHLQGYRIDPCSGGGYPDKMLVEIASGRTFAFELKATSTWDENDSNRRVLTSSSRKLRLCFGGAANHVLATILYSTENLRSRVLSFDSTLSGQILW